MNSKERNEKLCKIVKAIERAIKCRCMGSFSYYRCECYCGLTVFFTYITEPLRISISEEDFTRFSVDEIVQQVITVIKADIKCLLFT